MRKTIIFLILIIIAGCCPSDFDTSTKRAYVDKVFMNERGRYTFITQQNGESLVWEKSTYYPQRIHVYTDVPKEERMYVEYSYECSGGEPTLKRLDIHIHELDEIQGGSWNHGKFGRGQTQVIE